MKHIKVLELSEANRLELEKGHRGEQFKTLARAIGE